MEPPPPHHSRCPRHECSSSPPGRPPEGTPLAGRNEAGAGAPASSRYASPDHREQRHRGRKSKQGQDLFLPHVPLSNGLLSARGSSGANLPDCFGDFHDPRGNLLSSTGRKQVRAAGLLVLRALKILFLGTDNHDENEPSPSDQFFELDGFAVLGVLPLFELTSGRVKNKPRRHLPPPLTGRAVRGGSCRAQARQNLC